MNPRISLLLIVHGCVLIALAFAMLNLAPEIARTTLIWGVAGGSLCLVWGTLSLLGKLRRKFLPVLTLIPTSYVLLGQSIFHSSTHGRSAAVLIGTMVIGSVALLAYILHSEAK